MEHWIAGLLATTRELSLFFAPNINSYKRYVEGSFAPTAIAVGLDNRTCALRVVGHGQACASRTACPAATSTSTSRSPALIAGGLYGIENELELEPIFEGNAYGADAPRVPTTLREAARVVRRARGSRSAFGDEVVEHYLNNARVELKAFEAAVTDWERVRGFERM